MCHALNLWRDFELFLLIFLKLNRYPTLFWGEGEQKVHRFFLVQVLVTHYFFVSPKKHDFYQIFCPRLSEYDKKYIEGRVDKLTSYFVYFAKTHLRWILYDSNNV